MPLFEVAILQKPTKKEAEDGACEKLVFGPKAVVANDDQSAAIAAVMDGDAPREVGTWQRRSVRGHRRRQGRGCAARPGSLAHGGAGPPFCMRPRVGPVAMRQAG